MLRVLGKMSRNGLGHKQPAAYRLYERFQPRQELPESEDSGEFIARQIATPADQFL